MDDYFNETENKFVMMYHEYFNFHSSTTSSSIQQFCGRKGWRIDRVLKFELLKKSVGQTLTFGYQYKLNKEWFSTEYRIDSVKKDTKRLIWMHKDD